MSHFFASVSDLYGYLLKRLQRFCRMRAGTFEGRFDPGSPSNSTAASGTIGEMVDQGPSFDMVVIGCGGGPFETNLSAYLVKASGSNWEKDSVVGLEAGSGLGALETIMKSNPGLFGVNGETGKPYTAAQIFSYMKCYLITHSHLDHVNGLVLSAGSMGGQKLVHGRKQTIKDLEVIFADRLWPKLASHKKEDANAMLVYSPLPTDRGYFDLNRNMSVCSMPLTHGLTKTGSVYESAAYFLRNKLTERELLFFGDVEPDSISSKPQIINVWKAAAPKIPHTLASIFIECSWTSDRPDHLLFGHLNPVHLVDELVALALEVYKVKNNLQSASVILAEGGIGPDTRARKKKKLNPIPLESLRGMLDGVTVFIMHCKSDVGGVYDGPISHVIGAQVRALVEKKELGAEVVVLEQGTRLLV